MSPGDETAIAVARMSGALERQAEELRTLRSQLGVTGSEPARLLRADDVALRLTKSRAWVYRNQQLLGGFRVGGQLRFESEVIDRYLQRCQGEARRSGSESALLPLRGSARIARPPRA